MTDLRTQLADLIADLVDAKTDPIDYTLDNGEKRTHRVTHASLIDQLTAAIEPGGLSEDGRRIPASKPAARLDAIDRLNAIDDACEQWLTKRLYRARDDLKVNLRRLVGVNWAEDDLDDLVRAARRWLIWARTVTGWETEPWKPNGLCLVCGIRGGLRVRLEREIRRTIACCVYCGATWDESDLARLAQFVRAANGERDITDEIERISA